MIDKFWRKKWQLWPKNVINQIFQKLYYLISILEKACKTNGRHWPENLVLESKKKEKHESKARIYNLLFGYPNLRKNTLIQYFNWFTASFVYYALTLDSGELIPGNIYINFAVSGLIEFPAYTVSIFLLHYFGRRGKGFAYCLITS